MKITVIGTGYVGLTSGAMFADLGHSVTCIDKDEAKVKALKTGKVPFYEPGLDNLVQKHLGHKLKFTTDLASVEHAKVIMIAVGTPPAEDGSPDLSFVLEVARQIIPYLHNYKVIIMTEWNCFAQADMKVLLETMKKPVIIDGRNIFSPAEMKSQGFLYQGIGR